MTEIELLNGDKYFETHTENVLGEKGKGTTRWGEEISIVTSDENIEEIAARIIGDGEKPKQQPWHLTLGGGTVTGKGKEDKKIGDDKASEREKAIAEAIAKTKDLISHPPSAKGVDMLTFEEVQKRWGTKLSEEEIKVWVWYQRGRLFSDSAILKPDNGWGNFVTPLNQATDKVKEWVKQGLVCFDGTDYLPDSIFYAGNINLRIRKVAEFSSKIEETIGKAALEVQKERLLKSLPEALKISANESERLYINPEDPFCKKVYITNLADGTVLDADKSTLLDAFIYWLGGLSAEDFKYNSNEFEIVNYHLGGKSFSKKQEEAERIEIRRRSQQDCMALFSRFLFEALTREDQQIVEHTWNAEYNGYKEYDFTRIPVGFEMNRYFKNAPIDPKPTLWDGVKFLTANGSGIVAFDVGVGKTMTAILAVAQALYTGQCKRPLIIVPNPTYKKWISETVGEFNADGTVKVNGILPQYRDRINDFYNLGVKHEKNLIEMWPKDFTITFITYEGLQKLGFSERARSVIELQLYEILNQGLENRDKEKLREDIDAILGDVTASTIANFDDLGFDYIVCDEAHNFKNIFTRVKGSVDEEEKSGRQQSRYQLSSGKPSARGLKLFAVSQWVLKQNDMRNVVLLTATPFTNSPLEIYSMLALVAYQKLEKRGINNLEAFFDKFINEESEMSVTVKGKLEERNVIKSFNNRQVLQSIIFSSIIYKTGVEAGVQRPHKVVYPLLKSEDGVLLAPEDRIETQLRPTKDQEFWLREIARFANAEDGNSIEPYIPASQFDKNGKLQGRDLMAISLAKMVTLSPYLLHVQETNLFSDVEPSYTEYIESSPKLEYTMKCIRTIREWHEKRNEPISGVIIYMNLATDKFDLIKKYLVNNLGYAEKEVEIISGGMDQAVKERIKDKFLNGEVKVIIGSATIKEGIDLQNRTTCLFNLNLDWNPTDIQQLEGRAWRQGNQHSYVRIVTPLLENSIDVFMFQKLEEKTSRINDIWYRAGRGNVLKLEDFDPKELKMGLMTDPKERVIAEIRIEIQKLEARKTISEATVNKIGEARKAIEQLTRGHQEIANIYGKARQSLERDLQTVQIQLQEPELSKTKTEELTAREKSLSTLLGFEKNAKTEIAICKRYANARIRAYEWDWDARSIITTCDEQTKNMALIEAITKNVLTPKGLTMVDDLDPIITEATNETEAIKAEIENLKSKEYQDKRIDEVRAEMEEKKRMSKTIDERVKDFTRQNYLLSCLKGIHECSLFSPLIATVNKEYVKEAANEKSAISKKEEPQPSTVDVQYYLDAANYNLNQISRTAAGVTDSSSSANKKDVFVEGADAGAITKKNFEVMIRTLYAQRNFVFDKQGLFDFILLINRGLVKGVTKENTNLFRTENSDKFKYTHYRALKENLLDFCEELSVELKRKNPSEKEVLEMVAQVYFKINFTDHYFADGCGKTAEALAIFILMRYGYQVPMLPDRKKWYELAPKRSLETFNNSEFRALADFIQNAPKFSPSAGNEDKAKRIRIAKAKAAALKLKLQLENFKQAA